MDASAAKAAIEARLGRCLGYFEPSNRTQIAAHPDEVKALTGSDWPDELAHIRDSLKSGPPPGQVILTVAQAQQLLAQHAERSSGRKEKGDAKQST